MTERNPADLQTKLDAECFAKYGENTTGANSYISDRAKCMFTDEYKEQLELAEAEKKAELKRLAEAKKAEEDRIAKEKAEAFRNSPKGKTEAFVTQASGLCRAELKARAKFPSEVDFNWFEGNGNKYWMNFNEDGDSRVLIQQSGKMMNGFGNMVPFTGVCKYDYNPAKNEYSVVEVLI